MKERDNIYCELVMGDAMYDIFIEQEEKWKRMRKEKSAAVIDQDSWSPKK
jgi:hypothetical protein